MERQQNSGVVERPVQDGKEDYLGSDGSGRFIRCAAHDRGGLLAQGERLY